MPAKTTVSDSQDNTVGAGHARENNRVGPAIPAQRIMSDQAMPAIRGEIVGRRTKRRSNANPRLGIRRERVSEALRSLVASLRRDDRGKHSAGMTGGNTPSG